MDLLEALRLHPTGRRYPVFDRLRPVLNEDLREVSGDYLSGQVYRLSVTLGVDFKAIDRHLDEAVRDAKRRILLDLHEGTLKGLEKVRAAIYAGDAEGALAACKAIEEEIGL